MTKRFRYFVVVLIALAALAVIVGKRILYPRLSIHASTTTLAPGQSFLIILGVGDAKETDWSGSIDAGGANIQVMRGWRFSGTDAIMGTTGWTIHTHTTVVFGASGPVQENGLIVKIATPATPVTITVTTVQGAPFSFSSALPFGTSQSFLNGRVLVAPTGAQFQLTNSVEEEDFPSMAQSRVPGGAPGDDIYLAYTEFTHGDRSLAVKQGTTTPITDFSFLGRPAGMDQVLFMHYSISQRTWSGPFAVTDPGEDVMRNAVAIDGQGRAWIFYSAQRPFPSGNFDIYARSVQADGSRSAEIRLTSDPGTDLFPVATTDATGRVWVAWQGFRNNNLEVLVAAQTANSFTPETAVSTSPANNWEPAIAAASNGEVAISWDTYDKGDYDVYLRRAHFGGQISFDAPIPIAATVNFEARSSLAYDPQNRLWIAYELAGSRWGKDFGAYDTAGTPLYSNHTIEVRCLIGNDLYTTTQDVASVLPGAPATHFFQTGLQGTFSLVPDPTLAQNRQPGAGVGPATGPRNTFPRLATDSDGTVYLAFREPVGVGLSSSHDTGGVSAGSIWLGAMVYFDGSQWHGPGVLGFTDAVGDNRPSIISLGPGHLLIAHSSDHRLSPLQAVFPPNDEISSDVFQSELQVTRTQLPQPDLQRIGQITPDPRDPAVDAEAAAATLSRSYRPTVNGQRLQLVRGDFHRHTEISFDGRGDGPLIDAYRYYIDAASLGWAGCCDHDNGEAREYTWWLIQKFTDAYLLGSKYIPMFYYERSVKYPEGHRNVMFAQRGVRTLPRLPLSDVNSTAPAPDTTMLYNYLHFFNGITAAHTTATDQGTDWRNNDPIVEPFVEIYQGDRQDYEMAGAPRANSATDSVGTVFEDPGFVSHALLDKSYVLGFEASSDHISTHISFTNIWVKTPTRAGIMEALHSRRVYGSTDNILADFRSGTHYMGEAFTASASKPPVFTVRLFGTAPFTNVVVVKDNNIVYSTSGDRVMAFTWQDQTPTKGKTSYYYVRGLQADTNGNIVWVSPMWVTWQ